MVSKLLLPPRIKRSPGFGSTITVNLDDDGLFAKEEHGEARLSWAAFTRVVRLSDGLLLLRGKVIRWLPDSALKDVTPQQALELVQSNVQVTVLG
jgi:hypothetical protein